MRLSRSGRRWPRAGRSSRSPASTRTRKLDAAQRRSRPTAASRCRSRATRRRSACCRSTSGPSAPLSGDAAADARDRRCARFAPDICTRRSTASRRRRRSSSPRPTIAARRAQGDELDAGGPVTLRVRSNAPPGFTTTVWSGAERPQRRIATSRTSRVAGARRSRPSTRVEIRATAGAAPRRSACPGSGAMPIYVRERRCGSAAPPARAPATVERAALRRPDAPPDGASEHDPTSLAAVEVGADRRRRRAALPLRAGRRRLAPGRVAALAFDTPRGTAPNDRADVHDSRRASDAHLASSCACGDDQGEASRERWQRSVYVDTSDQERTVYFDDLTPVGETHTLRPVLAGDPQHPVRRRHDEHQAGRLRDGSGSRKRSSQTVAPGQAFASTVLQPSTFGPSGACRRRRRRRGCSAPRRRASATSSRRRRARRRC